MESWNEFTNKDDRMRTRTRTRTRTRMRTRVVIRRYQGWVRTVVSGSGGCLLTPSFSYLSTILDHAYNCCD